MEALDVAEKAKIVKVGAEELNRATHIFSDYLFKVLKITPQALPDFVLPNMTVDVSIEVRRADQSLALPVSAVALQASPPFVLVANADGLIERKAVRVIGRNPDWVAVLDLPPKCSMRMRLSNNSMKSTGE